MRKATAFAPCHITGLFHISDSSKDALHSGSTGAGISLDLGVRTVVKIKEHSKRSLEIRINGIKTDSAQVSKHVVNTFLTRFNRLKDCEINVGHCVDTPIGAGFGTSGAAALSLALALNAVLNLDLSRTEAAQIAHVAEVECKTGLGTVIAETVGGFEIRIKPGAPGIGEIRRVPVPEDTMIACLNFGPLSTKQFLINPETRRRIDRSGNILIRELIEKPTLTNFMMLSRQFAEHVGLTTERVRNVLNETDHADIICSMPMFGESVFTVTQQGDVDSIQQIFQKHGSNCRTIVCKVDTQGARLIP